MLQEEQTVTLQPECVWVHVPLYIGLFRLYLVLVTVWTAFRFARLLWSFGRQRMARQNQSATSVSDFWELASFKTGSFRTLSQLTLLIAVIVLAWTVSDDLTQIYVQKTSRFRAVAGALADVLKTFSEGIIVSAGLFCSATFCEGLIHRQQLGLTRTGNKSQPAPSNETR
jgi:hypothetical protein